MNTSRLRNALGSSLAGVLFLSLICAIAGGEEAKSIRVALVGDSTVTDKAGWGGALGAFFNDKVEVVNFARGGRSSKSYLSEGHLKKALAKKPDFVLIQFGHNDCPGKGPKRETDPETTFREYLKTYIRETRKIGAKPILVTSLTRRHFDKKGKIQSTLTPFAVAVREVGKETKVPVLDLHARSIELFERLGDPGSDHLQPEGDRTHLNSQGAKVIAELVVQELAKSDLGLSQSLNAKAKGAGE